MPGVRKLAYRDRFVWSLIQTMEGGSGMLPPLTFAPDVETPVLVNWTEQQWERIFSSLMNGADLTYPESAHQVVWDLLQYVEYPLPIALEGVVSRADIFSKFSTISGGTWTQTNNLAFMTFMYVMRSDTTSFRSVSDTIYLTPGNYEYRGIYAKSADAGIHLVRLNMPDGFVNLSAALDQFGLFNAEFVLSNSFTVTEAGQCTLIVENQGSKNAGSSAYRINWTSHHIWKV